VSATEDRQEALARMVRDRRQHNGRVRGRQYCVECDVSVREGEYAGEYWSKYMAAGGVLHGPFCSRECYYGALLEGGEL